MIVASVSGRAGRLRFTLWRPEDCVGKNLFDERPRPPGWGAATMGHLRSAMAAKRRVRSITFLIGVITESGRWAGGQGVAGSNPVVPTSIIAGRRPFPRVAGAALTMSGLGASGSPLGALVLPTRRRVNGVRFVRHPIRETRSAVPSPCAPPSTTGPRCHPINADVFCIERHKDPLSALEHLLPGERGVVLPLRQG
jgi:hypothetical protein